MPLKVDFSCKSVLSLVWPKGLSQHHRQMFFTKCCWCFWESGLGTQLSGLLFEGEQLRSHPTCSAFSVLASLLTWSLSGSIWKRQVW